MTTDQLFLPAARNSHLEHLAQQITLAEATMTVSGKGRMVWNWIGLVETAKPAVDVVQMYLSAEPPF